MKKPFLAALVVIGLASTAPARAQVFGQFTGGETLPVNGRLFGAYLQTSENTLGLLSQLRLSFYPNVDFGFMGGFSRLTVPSSNITVVRLGADLKVGVLKPTEARPFAIAVGGAVGLEAGDNYSVLTLGPAVVASRAFATGGSSSVTPYASYGIMFTSFDFDEVNDTDLSTPLRLGGDFKFGTSFSLLAEVQLMLGDSLNDNVGVGLGINMPF